MSASRKYCTGCRNDFYNGKNNLGVKECWSLKDGEVVKRYRVAWDAPQDTAANFTLVTTNSCHHAPGRYGFCSELPQHLRHERHLVRTEGER